MRKSIDGLAARACSYCATTVPTGSVRQRSVSVLWEKTRPDESCFLQAFFGERSFVPLFLHYLPSHMKNYFDSHLQTFPFDELHNIVSISRKCRSHIAFEPQCIILAFSIVTKPFSKSDIMSKDISKISTFSHCEIISCRIWRNRNHLTKHITIPCLRIIVFLR